MVNVTELLRQGKKKEIWDRFCGFLDLSIDEFMKIQKDLLMEQIERLAQCELGRKLLGKKIPRSVEEFRRNVPFTTYADYSEYLLNKREDVLPEKPYVWAHTSGRSGEYEYKWVPYTRKMYEVMGENLFALFLLSSCGKKGDISLKAGDKLIYSVAPPPYFSGIILQMFLDQFDFHVFPSPAEAIKMNFQKRIQEGIQKALVDGMDFFYGVTSVLMKISDHFSPSNGSKEHRKQFLKLLSRPKVFFRLFTAFIKAKLAKRTILPKDIWKIKGIICGGTDTSIFKEKIKELWGRIPCEAYGSTELGISSIQPWNSESLVFFPDYNFWEFIPKEEYFKIKKDPTYTPNTLLLNEVMPDKEYVMIGTNFHGGIFIRYNVGDLIKIVSLEDSEADIRTPQMIFSSRVNDEIDVGGFICLTEKTIWQAIEKSNLSYIDWTIRKELYDEKPILHLYIEMKDGTPNISEVEETIHECIKELYPPYQDMETMAGLKPLKLTVLSKGTFMRYYEEQQAIGTDLAHLKPPHVNPSDGVIDKLLEMSHWKV